jgi:serpin B
LDVDFVSNQGVDAINQWVSQKTNGKIEKLFEQDSTDELTLLAITNTIYFKGEWEYPFVPGLTWDADFFVDKDKTVKVKMMNRRINPINHMQNDLVQMIELPYKGDRLSMLVLLPSEKNKISKLEEQLSVNNLNQWKSQMSETMAEVYLPKFAADTDYDLKSILQDMGMDIPFDKEKADLSGIAPYPGIYIDTAVHKAAVEVNELGTEAAAATGAMAKLQSGPPFTFRADHPFVYMIEDKSTGQILFMGRVMDPTS